MRSRLLLHRLLLFCAFQLVTIPAHGTSLKRIVSATLTADEILWEVMADDRTALLSLSPLAKDQRYSNIAREPNLPQADFGPNLERLIQAKPDLVFISAFNKQSYLTMLTKFNVRYVPIGDLATVDQVLSCLESIGKTVGRQASAQALAASLRTRLKKLRPPATKLRVLSYSEGNILAGSHSLFDDVLRYAHAENVVAQLGIKGWQKVSAEAIAKSDPDIVILPMNADGTPQVTLDMLRSTAGWRQLKAVKAERIVWVSSALLSAASQYTINAVEVIHHAIYGASR